MRRSLLIAITSIVMSLSTITNAEENSKQNLLKQIDQLQIMTYDTTSNFLSYTLEDNKIPYNTTQYYADDKAASAQGNTLSTAIDTAVTGLAIKTAKPIQPLWAAYDKILNNEALPLVAPGGILDTFNIQELVKARNALNTEIEVIRKAIEADSPGVNQMASSIARKVKEISMTYTARISPEQGTFMAIDPNFDIKIESHKVSVLFDDLLSEAVKSKNTAQVQLISDAKTDWMFLYPVLSSDKKVQAASVVSIYSANIVKLLNQI